MSNDFFNESLRVANNFIQSVMFVDDRAFKDNQGQYPFDVEAVTKKGVEKGLICSAYAPEKLDDVELISNVVKKADAIILDWQIAFETKVDDEEADDEPDYRGIFTIQLLKQIIEVEDGKFDQHRIIFIYTGEKDLEDIRKRISDEVNLIFDKVDNFTLQHRGLRISIWAKETLESAFKHVPDNLKRIRSYEKLLEEIPKEHISVSGGLLTNACLTALTAIRNNLFSMISTFNSSIDAPYLSHRALLPNPSDAEELLFELICSEIKVIVDTPETRKSVNIEKLQFYINEIIDCDYSFLNIEEFNNFKYINFPVELDSKTIINMLKIGAEKLYINRDTPNLESTIFRENLYKCLTKFFYQDDIKWLDEQFAILTTQKKNYYKNKPFLAAGIIVKEKINLRVNYWICIQPSCDSVRITKNREFFFLKLKDVTTKEKKNFDIVLKEKEGYRYFKISYSVYECEHYKFKQNFNQMVQATNSGDDLIFKINGGNTLYFITELRNDFAQSISNNFASHLSRVGLNPSEWLRRSMN